ncbi:MAG: hypothetical protein SVM79_00105 [Chloroflexota bacterium]|nr:hypothetical protein [Chloroflexota bacterium]
MSIEAKADEKIFEDLKKRLDARLDWIETLVDRWLTPVTYVLCGFAALVIVAQLIRVVA